MQPIGKSPMAVRGICFDSSGIGGHTMQRRHRRGRASTGRHESTSNSTMMPCEQTFKANGPLASIRSCVTKPAGSWTPTLTRIPGGMKRRRSCELARNLACPLIYSVPHLTAGSERYRRLLPAGRQDFLPAAYPLQSAACGLALAPEFHAAFIGQFMLLGMGPNILHRFEFRSVGRQSQYLDPGGLRFRILPHHFVPMAGQAFPNDQQLAQSAKIQFPAQTFIQMSSRHKLPKIKSRRSC
jgi:hypothetical protein